MPSGRFRRRVKRRRKFSSRISSVVAGHGPFLSVPPGARGPGRHKPSSENRRILRKGGDIEVDAGPPRRVRLHAQRREFFKTYADIKFGKDIMTYERLDALFDAPITSHLLVFTERKRGRKSAWRHCSRGGPPGVLLLRVLRPELLRRNLGMFMMTSAVAFFKERGCNTLPRLLLRGNALYKTQFAGAEFFNGVRWSDNLDELKFSSIATKGSAPAPLETEEYREGILRRRPGENHIRERVPGAGQMKVVEFQTPVQSRLTGSPAKCFIAGSIER